MVVCTLRAKPLSPNNHLHQSMSTLTFWKPGTAGPGSTLDRATEEEGNVVQSAPSHGSLSLEAQRGRLPIWKHRMFSSSIYVPSIRPSFKDKRFCTVWKSMALPSSSVKQGQGKQLVRIHQISSVIQVPSHSRLRTTPVSPGIWMGVRRQYHCMHPTSARRSNVCRHPSCSRSWYPSWR